jgi:hypothetical protein
MGAMALPLDGTAPEPWDWDWDWDEHQAYERRARVETGVGQRGGNARA